MSIQQPVINDIFTFDPEYQYDFFLVNQATLTGYVIEARDNGIVLNTLEHIPTDKIVFFIPVQKNETEKFYVL